MFRLSLAIALLFAAAPAFGQHSALEAEMQKIDARAADPDTKPIVVAAMADELKVHRNHLVLLRKQTGENYSQIFVSTLEKNGVAQDAILARARALNREIDRRLGTSGNGSPASNGVRPVATVSTGIDHNSAGSFYWLLPEVGVDSRRASLIVGVPYYRDSATGFSAAGVGDVYATGTLYAHAWRTDFASALTVGFPTGDEKLGLGAGKVTADISGTVARSFERVRPFLSAGFANSISNFAYARPYIADGNAAHFSGGLEVRAAHRLTVGASGFGVWPFGSQVVYSRVMMGQPSGASGAGSGAQTPGGGMAGMGGGIPGGAGSPMTPPQYMPFLGAARSVVAASELEDYGPDAWASITVARGVSVNFAVARSVPFHLTTARIGLTLDVVRARRAH